MLDPLLPITLGNGYELHKCLDIYEEYALTSKSKLPLPRFIGLGMPWTRLEGNVDTLHGVLVTNGKEIACPHNSKEK